MLKGLKPFFIHKNYKNEDFSKFINDINAEFVDDPNNPEIKKDIESWDQFLELEKNGMRLLPNSWFYNFPILSKEDLTIFRLSDDVTIGTTFFNFSIIIPLKPLLKTHENYENTESLIKDFSPEDVQVFKLHYSQKLKKKIKHLKYKFRLNLENPNAKFEILSETLCFVIKYVFDSEQYSSLTDICNQHYLRDTLYKKNYAIDYDYFLEITNHFKKINKTEYFNYKHCEEFSSFIVCNKINENMPIEEAIEIIDLNYLF